MSTLRVNTLQNSAGTRTRGECWAWVNFNGTGTVAIRSAFNVSSVTDNGTGDYTVNFTTAMADANYAFCGCSNGLFFTDGGVAVVANTTAACRFSTMNSGGIRTDYAFNQAAVFGN